jgi:hypothetical protein
MPKPRTKPDLSALVELAARLDGKSLADEVELAVDDPPAYVKKFAKRMNDIGVDEPQPDLAWLALIAGLSEREVLREFDWKQECEDCAVSLGKLAGAPGKKLIAKVAADDDFAERYTHEALELIGKTVLPTGRALVCLDKRSDSYPMMFVAQAELAALQALARRGGGAINAFTGDKLAEYTADREKAIAKEARRAASTNPWKQLVAAARGRDHNVLWDLRYDYKVADQLEAIRGAMASAPKAWRPIAELVVAFHDGRASAIAKTADPQTCVKALHYLGSEDQHAREKLAALAIVADRLKLAPKYGRDQLALVEAANMFGDDKVVDAAFAALPAAARDRLARLADGVLAGAGYCSPRWHSAYRALRTVGDERSLAVIEASRAKVPAKFSDREIQPIDVAIARIRKRAKAATRRSSTNRSGRRARAR